MRRWIWGALAALAVIAGAAPDLRPGVDNWDTQVKTEVAWNLLHGAGPVLTKAPVPMYMVPGSDGRTYAPYPFVAYLLQVPSALAAMGPWQAYEGLAPLILLGLTALVLTAAGRRLGLSTPAALGGALLACLGTALRPMAGVGHDNGIEALALAALLWAGAGDERPRAFAWAGLVTGMALATRLGAFPLLVPAAVLLVLQRPRGWRAASRRAIAFSIGCAPGIATIVGFNIYRFGSPFELQPGVGDTPVFVPWFSAAHWDGVLGLAVSPGKGLLWYSPPLIVALLLLVPLARRFPAVLAAIGAYLAAGLLFYGRLTFWHGDWGWGPRYIAPVCVAAAPLAWWCWERLSCCSRRWRAFAAAAGLLLIGLQALPNVVPPVGYHLVALNERAREEGAPAPQLVFPMLTNSDYFYFRVDTSPLVELARGYARSLRQGADDPLSRYVAEHLRRALPWALLAPALALALVSRASKAGGEAYPRPESSEPQPASGRRSSHLP